MRWILRMAWRDTRRQRLRLMLLASAIMFGTGAIVAITSLRDTVSTSVDEQAKSLLGADLVLSSRQLFTDDQIRLIDSVADARAREITFASMVLFPKTGATRLIQVRAVEKGFPYYGALVSSPPEAAEEFRGQDASLPESGLLTQFDMLPGDSLRLGYKTFLIAGRLLQIPGESAANLLVSPPVYVPYESINETGLLQRGSRVNYRMYVKLNSYKTLDSAAAYLRKQIGSAQLSVESVDERKNSMGRGFQNLFKFLNLAGFISLILGGIGIGSAVSVWIRQKEISVAILRCLGVSVKKTFQIFLTEVFGIAVFGAALGVLLGLSIQSIIPAILQDFFPVALEVKFSAGAIAMGVTYGILLALTFALLPLLRVTKISPLLAIRSSYETVRLNILPRLGVIFLMALIVVAGAALQTRSVLTALIFSGGLTIALGILFLLGSGITNAARVLSKRFGNFTIRQALANLHRPNNQTQLLLVTLGLSVFLMTGLYWLQDGLVQQVKVTESGGQPNLVLFDIQSDQKNDVEQFVRDQGLPLLESVPIVTMRVAKIKGRTLEDLRKDTTMDVPRWLGELRCTYRDTLRGTEKLLSGRLQKLIEGENDSILISLEKGIANNLGLSIGDSLEMDVQGVPLKVFVGNIREVNWRRVQPNFIMIFPSGVLENAPQFHVILTRSPDPETGARFQQGLIRKFPNISAIDLSLILKTAENLLDKIAFAIRFMAFFSLFAGVIVLVSALWNTRWQRVYENILLRTLGGTGLRLTRIMTLEFLILGSIASLIGAGLALTAVWALAKFLFEFSFEPGWSGAATVIVGMLMLVVSAGRLMSRQSFRESPLAALRSAD